MVVKIDFNSAKVIPSASKPKDCLCDWEAVRMGVLFRDRDDFVDIRDSKYADKPFGFEQVSNLLHVLFGQRPVPSKQSSLRKRDERIDEIAKKAWFRIENTYYTVNDKNDKVSYITGFNRGRKLKQNSNRKDLSTLGGDGFVYNGSLITWSTLSQRYYYNDREKYDRIMNKFRTLYGSSSFSRDYALVDLIRYLVDVKGCYKELFDFFTLEEIKPLINVMDKDKNCEGFNKASERNNNWDLAKRTNNVQPLLKINLDGSLLVDIPDGWVGYLLGETRFATFLESGMAKINSPLYGSLETLGDEGGYKPLCV